MIDLSDKQKIENLLSLGYYANQISVYFKNESIVTHAGLYHFHKVGPNEAIELKDVVKTAQFLHSMFRNEFISIQSDHESDAEAGVMKMLAYAR